MTKRFWRDEIPCPILREGLLVLKARIAYKNLSIPSAALLDVHSSACAEQVQDSLLQYGSG
jgi:hypothetical protein